MTIHSNHAHDDYTTHIEPVMHMVDWWLDIARTASCDPNPLVRDCASNIRGVAQVYHDRAMLGTPIPHYFKSSIED